MQKIIDVVAAIIERDGKILLAQRPPHADQPGLWEFAGELEEELAIVARPTRYIASHQREVSGRLIHLHAWWVAEFHGEPVARYHSELRWCTPAQALEFDLAPADIPLLNAFIAQQAG